MDNTSPVPLGTVVFSQLLQRAGYGTAYVGKWHMGEAEESDRPRPGFDPWISFRGQGVYLDPELNVNGARGRASGYTTDVLTDSASPGSSGERRTGRSSCTSPTRRPHAEFVPPERYRGRYERAPIPYPVTMAKTAANYRGKPRWGRDQRDSWHGVDFAYHGAMDFDAFYRRYAETLLALDDRVGRDHERSEGEGDHARYGPLHFVQGDMSVRASLDSCDPDPEAEIRLSELAAALGLPLHGADVEVQGLAVDSRQVHPGDVFVAQRGEQADGARFIPEAVARGAVAACGAAPIPGLPTLVAADPRGAVPRLAATLYGHPASQLRLVGLTGTLGKTSTALLIQSALAASGMRVGVIGSLGVRHRGQVADTGMTTPDAPSIHRALRQMVDAGVTTAVLEVTSHGIALRRVAGLTFAVGALTNLVPDEHLDFHGTPEHYLRTKARFFDMLQPGAPLVLNRDDAHVRELVAVAGLARMRPVIGVSAEGDPGADVAVSGLRSDAAGSVFALEIRRPLPRADGGELAPGAIPLVLPVLGVHQVANAALAAIVALVAGGAAGGVTESVAELAPIRRRMEVVRQSAPTILDDTVGNPRALDAVFATVRAIPHDGLRVAFGIRGSRGAAINRRLAGALARAVRSTTRPVRLVVTASEDAAGSRDRVREDEREAVLAVLREEGIGFSYEPALGDAVRHVLEDCGDGDLVLLLGAQGMDGAAAVAREVLEAPLSP